MGTGEDRKPQDRGDISSLDHRTLTSKYKKSTRFRKLLVERVCICGVIEILLKTKDKTPIMGTGEDRKPRFRGDISSLDHRTLTSKYKK
ncbi:hypothetical protein YC2023_033123 [Brassica napus]